MVPKERCDDCICNEPWRYDEKKVKGDIDGMRDEIKKLWVEVSTKTSMRVFIFVFMLMSGISGAVIWDSNATAKKTNESVLRIEKKIIAIESAEKIRNTFVPVYVNGDEKKSGGKE